MPSVVVNKLPEEETLGEFLEREKLQTGQDYRQAYQERRWLGKGGLDRVRSIYRRAQERLKQATTRGEDLMVDVNRASEALIACQGSIKDAAKKLHIDERTLRRWIGETPKLKKARDQGLKNLAGELK